MDNKKNRILFFIVVGIATVIMALMGVTFAFFSVTSSANSSISATTASSLSVGLTVTQVLPSSSSQQGTSTSIVPLDSNNISSALKNGCVDSNDYVSCQVYEITITNSNADAALVTTNLQINNLNGIANLKWQLLTGTSSTDFAVTGTAITSHSTPSLIASSESLAGSGGTKKYYVVIWLENSSSDQGDSDAGKTFSGIVTSNVVDANGNTITGVRASFS